MKAFIALVFNTVFYYPLYNTLIFIDALVPGSDVGIAIVLLTVLVRFLLAPLFHSAMTTQRKMREIEPVLAGIKEKHKDNPEEQGKKIIELYRQHGINPFASLGLLVVQIPLLLGLYWVARDGFASASEAAYSFITVPAQINTMFLGFLDVTQPNIVLAAIAGITTFFQAYLAQPPKPVEGAPKTAEGDFAQTLSMQSKYVFPVLIFVFGLKVNAAAALYWCTSNTFSILHELYIRSQAKKITG